jgi:hypothetical protein
MWGESCRAGEAKKVLHQEFSRLTEDYNKTIFWKLTHFGTLLTELEIVMRGELGLVVDAVAYRSQVERQRTRVGSFLKDVLGNFGSSTNDQR